MRLSRLSRPLLPLAAALMLAGCSLLGGTGEGAGAAATAPSAGDVQLLEDVRILSADDMQGRDTGTAGSERARAYIVARLDALGVAAPGMGRLQPFEARGRTREGVKTFNGTNIIGVIPGTRVGDRYIVVTAHYDHVGVNDGQVFNGADDNASGAVALAFGKDTPQDTGEDNWVEASDHAAFYRAQIPFLYLGVNYHPDYHRPSDDFERITPSVFISATALSIAAFHALDRALDR